MKIKIKQRVFNDVYYPFLWDTTRYLHFYGGSGSGKSVFVAQALILRSFKTQDDTLVIRKIERTVKQSVYKLIKSIIYQWKLEDYFEFRISPAEIMNKVTGHSFVFYGLDDPEKVKSIAGIQKIWVEEATELNLNDYLELDRRLRGLKDHQIIFSYNPIDENHWLKIEFHNKQDDNAKVIKTTYLDNKFIDVDYKATLDRLRETDINQWRVYALGEWGTLNVGHRFNVIQVSQLIKKDPISIISNVKFFREFKPGQKYSIAIDGSSGMGADFTGLTIRGFYKEEGKHLLYAQMKAKVGTKAISAIAINLFNRIEAIGGQAYVIPERNSLGESIVNYLRDNLPEDRIYSELSKPSNKVDRPVRKYGYATTSSNRSGADPYLVDRMADLFHEGDLEVINEDEIKEMFSFIWNEERRRYEAQSNSHDDVLISDMLCVQGFEWIAKYG